MTRKNKQADVWTSASLVFFALAVLWNQSTGNQYGQLIGIGGLIIGLMGLWRAFV